MCYNNRWRGTLLHAAKDLEKLDVIFIGVNKGTLDSLQKFHRKKWKAQLTDF